MNKKLLILLFPIVCAGSAQGADKGDGKGSIVPACLEQVWHSRPFNVVCKLAQVGSLAYGVRESLNPQRSDLERTTCAAGAGATGYKLGAEAWGALRAWKNQPKSAQSS